MINGRTDARDYYWGRFEIVERAAVYAAYDVRTPDRGTM